MYLIGPLINGTRQVSHSSQLNLVELKRLSELKFRSADNNLICHNPINGIYTFDDVANYNGNIIDLYILIIDDEYLLDYDRKRIVDLKTQQSIVDIPMAYIDKFAVSHDKTLNVCVYNESIVIYNSKFSEIKRLSTAYPTVPMFTKSDKYILIESNLVNLIECSTWKIFSLTTSIFHTMVHNNHINALNQYFDMQLLNQLGNNCSSCFQEIEQTINPKVLLFIASWGSGQKHKDETDTWKIVLITTICLLIFDSSNSTSQSIILKQNEPAFIELFYTQFINQHSEVIDGRLVVTITQVFVYGWENNFDVREYRIEIPVHQTDNFDLANCLIDSL